MYCGISASQLYLGGMDLVAIQQARAATEADIDPDRAKFKRTVRIVRRRADPAAFPLNSGNATSHGSWPTSPGIRTSTRSAGTAPAPGWSSAPAATPTWSRNPATSAPGTTARPRSGWRTPS